MARITVVVTAYGNTDGLKYTLESLCEQTDEAFDVLIVRCGEHAGNNELIKSYCDEYVGFSCVSAPEDALIPQARNLGAQTAATELLLFMTEGDYLSPESVEAFMKAYEETKADVLCPRLYISGENEPYYSPLEDLLATVPHIGRFDEALMGSLDHEGRVYKKKFFDLYGMRFPERPAFYNTAFLTECLYRCDASATGVAGAIYDFRNGAFANGFRPGEEPNTENLAFAVSLYDALIANVRTWIEEETGAFEGDEYTFQQALFEYFTVLTDRFYRYFWFLTDADIETLKNKYEALSALMTEDRRKRISTAFADIRFPSMYMSHEDAAKLPMVSLLLDIRDGGELPAFLTSLYMGRFPFFEVFVPKCAAQGVKLPLPQAENLHVLPDQGFFAAARAAAVGVPINVKSAQPLDPKILSELATTRAPAALYQYLFASKRKKYSAKTYLKKKGMAMR